MRLADGAANPYLLQAGVIAAGMHGIADKIDPGPRYDIDMYAEGHTVNNAPKLPLTMGDALRHFRDAATLQRLLGEAFCASYAKLKDQEWHEFMHHFSDWERDNAIDV